MKKEEEDKDKGVLRAAGLYIFMKKSLQAQYLQGFYNKQAGCGEYNGHSDHCVTR